MAKHDSKSAEIATSIVLLPPERFFWRRIPLVADQDAATQAELAVESLGPFPTDQLYWGFLASPERDSAIIYSAHRRRFSAEETAAWTGPDIVVPSLLALFSPPARRPYVLVHAEGARLSGVAWAAEGNVPAAVLVREFPAVPTEEERGAFATELANRAGVSDVTPRFVDGSIEAAVGRDSPEARLVDSSTGNAIATAPLPESARDEIDVRDRDVLAAIRRDRKRSMLLWRVLLGGAAAAGLALLFEFAAVGLRVHEGSVRSVVGERQPDVTRLETANTLANRIDDLSTQPFRPFEMLVVLNDRRPRSIQFNKVTTRDKITLEIDAQTVNTADVENFVSALRELPSMDSVQPRNVQARDGVTSFSLTVQFKPGAFEQKEDAA